MYFESHVRRVQSQKRVPAGELSLIHFMRKLVESEWVCVWVVMVNDHWPSLADKWHLHSDGRSSTVP
jgi:hypothetical protein